MIDETTATAAAAVQEYEDAMTELLAYVRSGERSRSDLQLRTRLYEADIAIERLGLRNTAAYHDAVLRADKRAWALRAQNAKES